MHHSLFFLVLAVAAALLPTARSAGLTLDVCNDDLECAGSRICYDSSASGATCPGPPSVCVCAELPGIACSSDTIDVCPSGEICARTLDSTPFCASADAVDAYPDLFPLEGPPVVEQPSGSPNPVWDGIGRLPRGAACTREFGDCRAGLFCYSFSSSLSTCGDDGACRCVPLGVKPCKNTRACDGTLRCLSVDKASPVCLPDDVIPNNLGVVEVNETPEPVTPVATPPPSSAPSSPPSAKPSSDASLEATPSLDASPVATSAQPSAAASVAPVTSSVPDEAVESPEVPGETPVAVPIDPAASETPAESIPTAVGPSPDVGEGGDALGTPQATDDDESNDPSFSPLASVSATETATPTPSPSSEVGAVSTGDGDAPAESPEDEICVAAQHLEGVPRVRLVYAEDRRAAVLCDEQLSCATPGHMVVVGTQAEPMMMATYCQREGVVCERKVMWVNSLRYEKKGRIASRTEGLAFTVLAARYGTGLEERVLKVAVRAGL